jgi:serine/threonine protein kinase
MYLLDESIRLLEAKGYSCEGTIGSGCCSTVIKARKYGLEFACKISEKIPELKREAALLKMVNHAAFPQMFDFWQQGRTGCLIMEYAGEYNLDTMMKRRSFSEKETVETGMFIAEGLRYLHDMKRPLLYRDLKAENIVINGVNIKIVDMGSAAFIDEAGKETVGTWGYAPPEQMNGSGSGSAYRQDKYSDVYSFGRLMHYMLTKDSPYLPPFNKPDIRSYDNALDRELERLVRCCVRENPYERLPDMAFVLQELETIYYRMTHEKRLFNITVIRNRKTGNYLYEKNIILR